MATDRRTAVDRAVRLRSLHTPGDPLILVNVWDAASARVVAAQPGVAAIGTASAAIAAAHGVPDGEHLSVEESLFMIGRIADAVDLPVTADLERGYSRTADDVGETVSRLLTTGAVGCNLEDSIAPADATSGPGRGRGRGLRPIDEQVERLQAARERADRMGVPLVINARTDTLTHGGDVDEAARRGRAYLEAGADCVFVLGLRNLLGVRLFVDAFEGKLNVLARPGMPSVAELTEAGVCRISVGPGGMGVAYAALGRAATQLLGSGPYPDDMAFRPPAS